MEEWRMIEGHPDYYVSNTGKVKSFKSHNGSHSRILKQGLTIKGYNIVVLSEKSVTTTCVVHRLVAKAFIKNEHNLSQVNHKNEIKTDNRVENLEWCDALYNMNYGSRKEKQIAKLSKPVRCIETGIVYPSSIDAARKNPPVRQGNIILCCQGKNKSACGLHWEYA